MKQRVNIAATLVSDPTIVMLDEPSTGLDPRGMAEVRDIIRGLKKNNRLVFFSSHILSEVTEVCDEVALINGGKLLFYDTIDGVISKYAIDAPVIEVSLARPIDDPTKVKDIEALPNVQSVAFLNPTLLQIKVGGGKDGLSQTFEALAALKVGAMGFREAGSTLEQIYMQQITQGDQR
jgi:ABC-2 type transport system ATP-binding protein